MSRWAPKWRDATHDACYRALEAAEADRDRLREVLNKQNALLHDTARRVAELERKGEAYDAARAQVKREGHSRAEYVLRAENAERRVAELERKLLAEGLTVQEHKIKAEAAVGRVAELEAGQAHHRGEQQRAADRLRDALGRVAELEAALRVMMALPAEARREMKRVGREALAAEGGGSPWAEPPDVPEDPEPTVAGDGVGGEFHAEGLDERGIYGGRSYPAGDGGGA